MSFGSVYNILSHFVVSLDQTLHDVHFANIRHRIYLLQTCNEDASFSSRVRFLSTMLRLLCCF